MPVTILPANLAELTGPVSKDRGKARICEMRIGCMAGAIEASADGPAAIEAIFGGRVHAESVLGFEKAEWGELVARAPEEFIAEKERVIDGAAQGPPANGGVRAIEVGEEGRADVIVAARVGNAEIEIS